MKHIPNILSGFRILLIPFFILQAIKGNFLNAGIILIVSGLTDFLDGNLARKFGWVTNLGKILDPIADKLTQAAVSLTLAIQLRQYWYFFAIMIAKDIIILIFGGYLMKQGIKLEGAKWFGKISTFSYYIVMILILLFPNLPQKVVLILLFIATALALIAMFLYIPEYQRYKKNMNGMEDKEK